MNYSHCEAYSFGKSNPDNKGPTLQSYGPGPGKYYPETTLTKPSPFIYKHIRISTDKRLDKAEEKTPGVGDYNLQSSNLTGPAYTMRSVVDGIIPSKECSPGPCRYDIRTSVKGPLYSLGQRHMLPPDNALNPGPGEYNLRKENSFKSSNNSNFGKELRNELHNMNGASNCTQWKCQGPSPCDYDPNYHSIKKKGPTCSIDKAKREDLFIPKYPGPALYSIKPMIGNEGAKHSFNKITHERVNTSENNRSPGPGQYNSTFADKPSNPCFKMNLSPRNDSKEKDKGNERYSSTLPGPCDYSIDSSTVVKKSFSNAPLWGKPVMPRNNMRDSSGPSTGKYNISNNMGNGPKFSLGTRIPFSTKWLQSIPGPGSYETNKSASNLRKNPSWIIGHEPRIDSFSPSSKTKLPGPAEYSKDNHQVRPNLLFNKENRVIDSQTIKESHLSGPGLYKIPCSIVDVNSYTRNSGKYDPQFKYV